MIAWLFIAFLTNLNGTIFPTIELAEILANTLENSKVL
jgi:hypothetical protein